MAQGGNVHLVRSATMAAEMEFATRWCGNYGVLLWVCARKKNSRFDGGIVAAAVADALVGRRTRGDGVVVLQWWREAAAMVVRD